jgi:hypothetical protein
MSNSDGKYTPSGIQLAIKQIFENVKKYRIGGAD